MQIKVQTVYKIAEFAIETFAIELLEKTSHQYVYGPAIAPDSGTPERESFEEVLLIDRLREAVGRFHSTGPLRKAPRIG